VFFFFHSIKQIETMLLAYDTHFNGDFAQVYPMRSISLTRKLPLTFAPRADGILATLSGAD